MKKKTILIVGARSDIAQAIARVYAEENLTILLAARNSDDLNIIAQDLVIRGADSVKVLEYEATSLKKLQTFVKKIYPLPDIVVCAVGYLGVQKEAQQSIDVAQNVIDINFTGPCLLFEQLAEKMIKRGSGTLVGISSVAGDRGRASNYFYGSAKAGFSTYLSGLRQRASEAGIHVLTVKPGFVRTSMTADINLPNILTTTPEIVAQYIVNACNSNTCIVYAPWYWRWIMLIIRLIPEKLFAKLKL